MNDIMEQLCGKIGDADYQKKSVIVQGITGKFGSRHTNILPSSRIANSCFLFN